MHEFHCIWMFIALRHYQSVRRVSWKILSWPLFSFNISLVRVIVTLVFRVCLSRPCSITDDVRAKLPTNIMKNLTPEISAETMTCSIGMHVQSDECTTPHEPPYWNSISARTIWVYFHTGVMSSIYSVQNWQGR
jgi:hypothetical protein